MTKKKKKRLHKIFQVSRVDILSKLLHANMVLKRSLGRVFELIGAHEISAVQVMQSLHSCVLYVRFFDIRGNIL